MIDKSIDLVTKKKTISHSKKLENLNIKYLPVPHVKEYFFISYSHLDYRSVYNDLLDFQDKGLKFWYDLGMPAGKDWKEIANSFMAPVECRGVIFYISENSLRSKATMDEIEYATKLGKPIIAINLLSTVANNNKKTRTLLNAKEMIELIEFEDESIKKMYKKTIDLYFPEQVIFLPISMNIEMKISKILSNLDIIPKLTITKGNIIRGSNDPSIMYITNKDFDVALNNKKTVNELKYTYIPSDLMKNLDVIEKHNIENALHQKSSLNYYFFVNQNSKQKPKKDDKPLLFLDIGVSSFANFASIEKIDLHSTDRNKKILINSVSSSAFANCISLKEFNADFLLADIYDYAFYNCYKLKSIPGVVSLNGKWAFYNCRSLEQILLHCKQESIYEYSFANCTSLRKVEMYGGMTANLERAPKEIGKYAFSYCSSLKSIDIPESVTKIKEAAFLCCKSLKDIVLPPELTYLGESAFEGCSSLESIELPKTLKEFSFGGMFWGCINLAKIIIHKDNPIFKSIDGVVYSKDGLTLRFYPPAKKNKSFIMDDSVIILHTTFENEYLNSLSFSNSLTHIESSSVFNCRNLETIVLPKDIQYVAKDAFFECPNLKKIVYQGLSNDFYNLGDIGTYNRSLMDGTKQNNLINPVCVQCIDKNIIISLPDLYHPNIKKHKIAYQKV